LTGIIGKFGVGFYSAFMVADKVQVFSQSASGSESHVWSSDGSGSYEVAAASDVSRGSKIVIHLKESCKDYGTAARVEAIIRRYSNFVSFPIILNGETVNTVQALWTKSESEVTDEEYTEFYKFIANAFDEPAYRIIFKADAPIELKTLFFIGSSHSEKFGYARLEPGVSLYSRKVLIERNSPDILPDWLRFVRGVVDSEDLPLSLSREKMQDSRLILKIKDVLTRRIIRFLEQQVSPCKIRALLRKTGRRPLTMYAPCLCFVARNSRPRNQKSSRSSSRSLVSSLRRVSAPTSRTRTRWRSSCATNRANWKLTS
jgi:HSP90 family molecular chaperone